MGRFWSIALFLLVHVVLNAQPTSLLKVTPDAGDAVGQVKFEEKRANGTDAITLKAPDSVTTGYEIILPPAGLAGYFYRAVDGTVTWNDPTGSYVTLATSQSIDGQKRFDQPIIMNNAVGAEPLSSFNVALGRLTNPFGSIHANNLTTYYNAGGTPRGAVYGADGASVYDSGTANLRTYLTSTSVGSMSGNNKVQMDTSGVGDAAQLRLSDASNVMRLRANSGGVTVFDSMGNQNIKVASAGNLSLYNGRYMDIYDATGMNRTNFGPGETTWRYPSGAIATFLQATSLDTYTMYYQPGGLVGMLFSANSGIDLQQNTTLRVDGATAIDTNRNMDARSLAINGAVFADSSRNLTTRNILPDAPGLYTVGNASSRFASMTAGTITASSGSTIPRAQLSDVNNTGQLLLNNESGSNRVYAYVDYTGAGNVFVYNGSGTLTTGLYGGFGIITSGAIMVNGAGANYYADGLAGVTRTVNLMGSGGSPCSITFTKGIATASTCP